MSRDLAQATQPAIAGPSLDLRSPNPELSLAVQILDPEGEAREVVLFFLSGLDKHSY